MLKFGTENKEITSAPFILSISDNSDNQLKIAMALSKRGEKGEELDLREFSSNGGDKLQEILIRSYPVYEDMDNVYQIFFERYIIYQCRNESYTTYNESETRKGNYLIIFEHSRLLDYYKDVIFDFDYEQTKSIRKHYGIYTENHIIDIISNTPPIITKVQLNSGLA